MRTRTRERPRAKGTPRIAVVGSGKVGRALAGALREAGLHVALRSGRARPRAVDADVIVLAVRDARITEVAAQLAEEIPPGAVVLHVAGALGPEALAPLRGACAGVGQMHPLVSFASASRPPGLRGATLLVGGDRAAASAARALGRALGMTLRSSRGVDLVLYHTAAALLANGAGALAAAAARLLEAAAVPARARGPMLGQLLRTVSENVEALGPSRALTGPVRRGDAGAVRRQREALSRAFPDLGPLLDALVAAQLPLAQALGEADPRALRAIDALVRGPASRRKVLKSRR